MTLLRVGRRADVLYVNGLALEAVVANLLLRRPLVLKVVGDLAWERATLWGWVTDGFERFQHRRYGLRVEALRGLRAWWSRRADMVIVPSRYLARWVGGWGVSEDRVRVIYNAVDLPEELTPAARPLPTPRTVVAAARLVPWKQIDRVIEAIAPLDGVGLVVLGDGPERAALERRAAELGMRDRVHFAGTRAAVEALALMAACDAFVLYSLYEGLPHVVLEAMALDLPVVATPIGGISEVVEDGRSGLLVDPTDTTALQAALRRVLFSEEERRRLRDGAARTLERFRPQTMLAETERVLTGLVARPAPAAARRDA